MLQLNISLALAVILLGLGVVQLVRPFSAAPINPVMLIVAAALLVARYFAVRQRQRRTELLKNIPEHPLGIDDTGDAK